MTHPYFRGAKRPRVLAHRGLSDGNPDVLENTAAAFAAAHVCGAEFIETDVRTTADGDAVLFHDATLHRLFADPRPVAEVTTRELAELLAPYGGLLTVGEALAGFPETRFNIDVKTDAAAAPVGRAVASHGARVLLTAFSDRRRREAMTAARTAGAKIFPAASAGRTAIAKSWVLSWLRLSPARVLRPLDALQIPERYGPLRVFTPSLLRAAHRHGVEVHVWTVNDIADMRRLVEAGADGIVTDRADVAVDALH